jgi:hypothetical protein
LRYIWGGDEGREANGSGKDGAFGVSVEIMGLVEGIV